MRTELIIGDKHYTFDSPADVPLTGVTVQRNGTNFSTINNLTIDGEGAEDEVFTTDDGTVLVFHYYRMAPLSELMKEFDNFAGMKVIEIHEKDVVLIQTI